MSKPALDTSPEVIVTNLHWRYTGVTAANRRIGPGIALRLRAVWFGRHRPAEMRALGWGGLWRLRGKLRRAGGWCVWHARRNDEMFAGVVLRALGWRLRLVCLSAAQREHSAFTHWLYRRMDAIVAISQGARGRVGGVAAVIPHGVDTEVFRPAADRRAVLTQLGVPGRRAIGTFGRVRAQKGTDVFIAAMCRLLPKHPEWTAVIVGAVTPDQEEFAEGLRREVAAAGLEKRILFVGEQAEEDLPRWFQAVTVYAFCSRIEGFGLTLLEAMASGCGLVASRAGAAEELVEDRVNGRLIAPGEAGELVAALEPLMAEPALAEEWGRRARETMERGHSLEGEVEAISRLYQKLR